VRLEDNRYALATHYHIDHAGLAQQLQNAGVPLLVLEVQVSSIPLMKTSTKPRDQYLDIAMHDNVTISFAESRTVLGQIGIVGEILQTPGDSEDSVTLLLDEGAAVTGGLTPPALAGEDKAGGVAASRRMLRDCGRSRLYS